MNCDKDFALFEKKMLKDYNLKPCDLEKIELFTILTWLQEDGKNEIERMKKIIKAHEKRKFEQMRIKNGRTNY